MEALFPGYAGWNGIDNAGPHSCKITKTPDDIYTIVSCINDPLTSTATAVYFTHQTEPQLVFGTAPYKANSTDLNNSFVSCAGIPGTTHVACSNFYANDDDPGTQHLQRLLCNVTVGSNSTKLAC